MTEIRIVRDTRTSTATFGRLWLDGIQVCHTLELPWLDNEPNVSCVPEGRYRARVRDGVEEESKFRYKHIHILDVPGRSWILIHKGNYPDDITGCILVGTRRGINAVWESSVAFGAIMSDLLSKNIQMLSVEILSA